MTDETKACPFYYEPQETAMAPGISGAWPDVIQLPGMSKHARLVKRRSEPNPDEAKAVGAVVEAAQAVADAGALLATHYPELVGTLRKALSALRTQKSHLEAREKKRSPDHDHDGACGEWCAKMSAEDPEDEA